MQLAVTGDSISPCPLDCTARDLQFQITRHRFSRSFISLPFSFPLSVEFTWETLAVPDLPEGAVICVISFKGKGDSVITGSWRVHDGQAELTCPGRPAYQ